MAILDTSFMPLGNRTLRTGLVGTSTSRLYDFNFGGNILIPIHHRFTPYGLLAAGILFNTYDLVATRPDGVVYVAGRSDVKFAFETGGGARYFVTEAFGVRGEYRFTASTQNFSRVLFGVFYQFDGTWPFRSPGKGRRSPPER
jgi:opacity protein-like surface antigen